LEKTAADVQREVRWLGEEIELLGASSISSLDWLKQMVGEMAAAGMDAPSVIIADGRLRRFAPETGRGDSGWYVVHSGEHFTSWGFGGCALKKDLRGRRAAVEAERLPFR
jgi:hypothetical protein